MSEQKVKNCPNCNAEIREAFFGVENLLISNTRTELINHFLKRSSLGYCTKCSKILLEEAAKEYKNVIGDLRDRKERISKRTADLIDKVPLVTLQYTQDWKYTSLEIVTAQAVIGTGVIAEIASNWTDFFGAQSSMYNEKLKKGEAICKNMLRLDALKMGGNAILGVDIDYSEAGGGKGMLMVCMAGTAVKISNLKDLSYDFESIQELEKGLATLKEIDLELEDLKKFETFERA